MLARTPADVAALTQSLLYASLVPISARKVRYRSAPDPPQRRHAGHQQPTRRRQRYRRCHRRPHRVGCVVERGEIRSANTTGIFAEKIAVACPLHDEPVDVDLAAPQVDAVRRFDVALEIVRASANAFWVRQKRADRGTQRRESSPGMGEQRRIEVADAVAPVEKADAAAVQDRPGTLDTRLAI